MAVLEKKKRRLEDDTDRYKKRYQDAEKCLKTSQDDTVQLKTALQDCKKMSEKIAHTVDKALPTPKEKKKTPSTPKKEEVKKGDICQSLPVVELFCLSEERGGAGEGGTRKGGAGADERHWREQRGLQPG